MLSVEVGGERRHDADDEFRFFAPRFQAFLTVPCAFFGGVAPESAKSGFHRTGKEPRALPNIIPERHRFLGDVVQHAFHCAGRVADRATEIRLGPDREVTDRACDPVRGGGSAACFQLDFGNLHGALESVVAARDYLAVHHLPAYASMFEVVVQFFLERVGVKILFFRGATRYRENRAAGKCSPEDRRDGTIHNRPERA